MIVIREHQDENPVHICHLVESGVGQIAAIGIDERFLAWVFVAPGMLENDRARALVRWALELVGPEAWIAIQTASDAEQKFYEDAGLAIVETFGDDQEATMRLHLALTAA